MFVSAGQQNAEDRSARQKGRRNLRWRNGTSIQRIRVVSIPYSLVFLVFSNRLSLVKSFVHAFGDGIVPIGNNGRW